jgi:hypothetical protein
VGEGVEGDNWHIVFRYYQVVQVMYKKCKQVN